MQRLLDTPEGAKYEFMQEMTTSDMDRWVSENIGLSRCAGETELFSTKWFDYRNMHPLVATCLFSEIYKVEYARIMLTHGRDDFQRAPFRTGLKRVAYQDHGMGVKTSLWRARQFADKYCCSYDYYISTMLSVAAQRLWANLPRPQHLWQDDLVAIFEQKLARRAHIRIDDSIFSYHNMPQLVAPEMQKDYCMWVIQHIDAMKPSSRVNGVLSAVYLRKLIPEVVAEKRYPKLTNDARELYLSACQEDS